LIVHTLNLKGNNSCLLERKTESRYRGGIGTNEEKNSNRSGCVRFNTDYYWLFCANLGGATSPEARADAGFCTFDTYRDPNPTSTTGAHSKAVRADKGKVD